ncbi:MAG TPA: hypothetical protein VG755_39025 [Nannocystaceae bacterium]|nr:hypothetical protein [Nannocystaceae bacterium]
MLRHGLFAAALWLGIAPVAEAAKPAKAPDPARAYHRMVKKVANMVNDERAWQLVQAQRLSLVDVMWEDTGRWIGSSVGPNISDVTIEVEGLDDGKRRRTYLMPVMRHDNFTDKTADIQTDDILLPVGNQREDGELELVTLTELLEHPTQYMTGLDEGSIKGDTLLAKRDTHVLVSAQHAFLPVPKGGTAEFWPVIFNYQSTKRHPAVLTILVTRQGTSFSIVDNAQDQVGTDGSWGQRLYFNAGGKKSALTAERLADVEASGTTSNGESADSLGEHSNVLMLIQVPLKVPRPRPPKSAPTMKKSVDAFGSGGGYAAPSAHPAASSRSSDVDVAVLGHGPAEGEFRELGKHTITRDPRFPVRVTLQFYQATSNGVVWRADVKAMSAQIKQVYKAADFVGSLVVPSDADRRRPTNWTGVSVAPPIREWRDVFVGLQYASIGLQALL